MWFGCCFRFVGGLLDLLVPLFDFLVFFVDFWVVMFWLFYCALLLNSMF